jgi:hypothetical protein
MASDSKWWRHCIKPPARFNPQISRPSPNPASWPRLWPAPHFCPLPQWPAAFGPAAKIKTSWEPASGGPNISRVGCVCAFTRVPAVTARLSDNPEGLFAVFGGMETDDSLTTGNRRPFPRPGGLAGHRLAFQRQVWASQPRVPKGRLKPPGRIDKPFTNGARPQPWRRRATGRAAKSTADHGIPPKTAKNPRRLIPLDFADWFLNFPVFVRVFRIFCG